MHELSRDGSDRDVSQALGASAARWLTLQSVVAIYSIFYAYTLSDADVVINAPIQALPLVPAAVSTRVFLILASFFVFACFLYLQITLHRVRSQTEMGNTAEVSAGSIWIFSELISAYVRPISLRPHGHRAEAFLAWIFIWSLAPWAEAAISGRLSALANPLPNTFCLSFLFLTWVVSAFYFFRHKTWWISRLSFCLLVLWAALQSAIAGIALIDTPLARCQDPAAAKREYPASLRSVVDDVCASHASFASNWAAYFSGLHIQWSDSKGSTWAIGLLGTTPRRAQLLQARLSRYRSDLGDSDGPHAYLHGASIRDLDLKNAQLFDAFANKAKIESSDLSDVFAISAKLREAFIAATPLDLADLQQSDLREAELSQEFLKGTDFSDAELDDVEIWRSVLDRVNFRSADMKCAAFLGDFFIGPVDFTGANLTDAFFVSSDLRKAVGLESANTSGACEVGSLLPKDISLPDCAKSKHATLCPAFVKKWSNVPALMSLLGPVGPPASPKLRGNAGHLREHH